MPANTKCSHIHRHATQYYVPTQIRTPTLFAAYTCTAAKVLFMCCSSPVSNGHQCVQRKHTVAPQPIAVSTVEFGPATRNILLMEPNKDQAGYVPLIAVLAMLGSHLQHTSGTARHATCTQKVAQLYKISHAFTRRQQCFVPTFIDACLLKFQSP